MILVRFKVMEAHLQTKSHLKTLEKMLDIIEPIVFNKEPAEVE